MRSLVGFLVFLAIALIMWVRDWSPDPHFALGSPSEAVASAAMLTPLIATWVMPDRSSLLIYPIAVVCLWSGAGYADQHFIPSAPEDQRYVCGLAWLEQMFAAVLGIVLGVVGRAIGLAVRGQLKSGLLTYIVQIVPFAAVVGLMLLAESR
jgi:hypothetical protein